MRRIGTPAGLLAAVTGLLALFVSPIGPAYADPVEHRRIVNPAPSSDTPDLRDGEPLSIAESRGRVYVGGSFTRASDRGTTAEIATPRLLAFDTATGRIDRAFKPELNGLVRTVLPSADGQNLFVGGDFTYAGAVRVYGLVKLDAATGAVDASFSRPQPNGRTADLQLLGGRVLAGGTFTAVNGTPRGGLLSFDATSGAVDTYLDARVSTNHNWVPDRPELAKAPVGVVRMTLAPDGSRLVAVGNFKTVDGLTRDQIVSLDLGGQKATVDPDWRTRLMEPACAASSIDSYARDVEFDPSGDYFVVVNHGGTFANTLCDAAARFDSASSGQDVPARWIARTGADQVESVAVSDVAVYVGGHHKFWNAENGGADRSPGQVPRPGIAALDPASGVPLEWNPGRHPRGDGAPALLVTERGLYIGSDTDYIGNRAHYRGRIAFFPTAEGPRRQTQPDATLPGSIYTFAGRKITARTFDGTTAGPAQEVENNLNKDWTAMRGAFMMGDRLVYGWNDWKLRHRTLTEGRLSDPGIVIDPYNDPDWSDISVGNSTSTYRGQVPRLYNQLSSVAGITYADDRIYYTRLNDPQVYWRWFSPDSLIMGGQEFVVGAVAAPPALHRTLFHAEGKLYAGLSNGGLYQLPVEDGRAGAGSWQQVVGAGGGWGVGTTFTAPRPNLAPIADFTSTCDGRTCGFDASASSDPDGAIERYEWDFGDGASAIGRTPTHTFAQAGTAQVALTVTDDRGSQHTRTVAVTTTVPSSPVGYRASAAGLRNATTNQVIVPAGVRAGDGLVAIVSTATNIDHRAPAGWQLVSGRHASGPLATSVWQRVATAADAGSGAQFSFAQSVKSSVTLLAYSGTAAGGPVARVVVDRHGAGTTSHRTPQVQGAAGDWLVSAWATRSSAVTALDATGVSMRERRIGTGGGHVDSLVADSNGGIGAAVVGGHTATSDAPAYGLVLSILIR